MRITEIYGGPTIPVSYEIFPPKGDLGVDEARTVLKGLKELDPAFVSVTYSAGGSGNSERTVEIADIGQRELGLTMMAHLTCAGATKADMAKNIQTLKEHRIENVLALRGDLGPGHEVKDYRYARELIPELREAGFCVGAACYPEGHVDCFDMNDSIKHLQEKQAAGAQFFVSQLFFDNRYAYKFLNACRAGRIRVPIELGIMPVTSKSQVQRMVFMCGASLPSKLVKILARYEDKPDDLRKAGIEYASQQLIGLAQHGVDALHIYSMNNPDTARQIYENIKPYL